MSKRDTERLDFLSQQKFTRWVGYDRPNGNCVWPVFTDGNLRREIDAAMQAQHQERRRHSGARKGGT